MTMLFWVFFLFSISLPPHSITAKKKAGYALVVQKLQDYIESNETFAKLVNQTLIESGHGPNTSQPVNYVDMYNFFNQILNFAPNGSQAYYTSNIIVNFTGTMTGNQLVSESKSIAWFNEWINVWCQYLDSYNSTSIIPTWYAHKTHYVM